MSQRKWVIALGAAVLLLTACGKDAVESVSHHLEKAVELEIPFEEQQDPLQAAEKKENELFEEIVSLGMDDIEKINTLSDEAISSIDSRETMLMKEKESIESSFEEFKQVDDLTKKLDGDLSGMLQELTQLMKERHDTYQNLFEKYKETIHNDTTLFTMLTNEELTLEELQAQIDQSNEMYEMVLAEKEKFNALTSEYNEKKRKFYEAAGLNVRYES